MSEKLLASYVASYINTELERGHAIESDTIINAIEAFEGGAHGQSGEYKVTCAKIFAPAPNEAALKDYDAYQDKCEQANKIPLDYESWLAHNQPTY